MILFIIFLIIVVISFIIYIRSYTIKFDTICLFVGSIGSGKTFNSVRVALRCLRKNRFKTKIYNILHPTKKLKYPLLYSNIPVRITKKEMCQKLTSEILLEREKIIGGSIVLMDEIDTIANQYEYDVRNVIARPIKGIICPDDGSLDDNIRFFRHYYSSAACEPKLICNTQCSDNVVKIIRSRLADTYQTFHFRKLFRIWWCGVVHFVKSEDIQPTSENEDRGYLIGLLPRKKNKPYDSHCYSGRVANIPLAVDNQYKSKKTNKICKLPYDVQKSLLIKDDK